MPSSDGLAIIVLNWNRREETRRCVESCPVAERIYVLNNGCVDGEPHVPDGRRRETVIESPTNLGYAAGVNLLVSARVKREIGGFDAT
jgi:GT2 family glycosyltransferase